MRSYYIPLATESHQRRRGTQGRCAEHIRERVLLARSPPTSQAHAAATALRMAVRMAVRTAVRTARAGHTPDGALGGSELGSDGGVDEDGAGYDDCRRRRRRPSRLRRLDARRDYLTHDSNKSGEHTHAAEHDSAVAQSTTKRSSGKRRTRYYRLVSGSKSRSPSLHRLAGSP